jgi:hypothetical protein
VTRQIIFTIGLSFTTLIAGVGTSPNIAAGRGGAEVVCNQSPQLTWFVKIFHDFDFLGDSPIKYTSESSSRQSYPLAEVSLLLWQGKPEPFPVALAAGKRYILRSASLKDDPFYQQLEKRFRNHGMETNVFMPHSVMAVVYDPPIPVRFVEKPRLVLQPMCIVFHGLGFEGLVIRDEPEQVSAKRRIRQKTNGHNYSLLILKVPH